MTRRVPELALLAGLLLAGSLGAFALWATGRIHQSILTAVALLYPFAGYAVYVDDDPTNVLLPRWTALAGIAVGLVVVLDVLVQAGGVFGGAGVLGDTGARAGGPPSAPGGGGGTAPTGESASLSTAAAASLLAAAAVRGLLLGSIVALPPLTYAVGYDRSLGPAPRSALYAGVAVAVAVPVVGVIAGTWYGAPAGFLLGLAGGLYADHRGYYLTRRQRGGAVVAGLALAVAVAVLGVTAGAVPLAVVLSAVALLATPAVFFALTVETTGFSPTA